MSSFWTESLVGRHYKLMSSPLSTSSPLRKRIPYTQHDRLRHVRKILGENTPAALAYAVAEFRWDAVERIIVEGELPPDTVISESGQTAMVQCVLLKQLDGVALLSRLGADLNARWRGAPLLHLAVMAGSSEVCGFLVNSGVDVDERDESRYASTALHIAAQRGSRTLCYTLLRLGADKDALDSEGRTAMDTWNEAAMHPLETTYVLGVQLNHRELFHWFSGLPSFAPHYGPPTDTVMIEKIRPWLDSSAAPSEEQQRLTIVAKPFRYVANVSDVIECLQRVETFGVPLSKEEITQRVQHLASQHAGMQWLTFDGFCAAIFGLAKEL